jgi:hypothetical protein
MAQEPAHFPIIAKAFVAKGAGWEPELHAANSMSEHVWLEMVGVEQ